MTIDFDIKSIKAFRKRHDLTQHQFAQEAGVSQSLIAKIEAEDIDPAFSKVKEIASAMDRLSNRSEKKALEIMTDGIESAKLSETADSIAKRMAKKGISQMPVLDGNKVVGLIAESDLLEASSKGNLSELKARQVMASAPPTIPPDTPISVVRNLLKFSTAAIVEDRGEIKGIITKADIIKFLLP